MAGLFSRRRRQYSGFRLRHLPALVLADLTIFRVGGDFDAAALAASPALPFQFTADQLGRLKLGGLEDLLTEATSPFDNTGVYPTVADQPKNLEALLE